MTVQREGGSRWGPSDAEQMEGEERGPRSVSSPEAEAKGRDQTFSCGQWGLPACGSAAPEVFREKGAPWVQLSQVDLTLRSPNL